MDFAATPIRTLHPVAGVVSAQGLDVSNFQGKFDWKGAIRSEPGLAFGIHRVTQGLGGSGTNSPDPDAVWNHQQIRDNGLRRGAYHFLDPRLDGAAQARYYVDTLSRIGLVKSDILACDNETAGASPGATAACADAFLDELIKLRPNNPRLEYTFINFAKEGYCAGGSKYPLWLAYPAASAPVTPPPWTTWKFWQWGLRNGIDADAFNGTVTELDSWIASFNPPPGPVWEAYKSDGTKSLLQISTDVHMATSTILRATAVQYQAYDPVTADYLNAIFSGNITSTAPVPAGATFWVRR